MNYPLISIIIPVYNAEKYLRQCLDSVIAQTYTNWEGLLIDDGSTDGSGRICDEYSLADARFRVIHKENGGVSSARNCGIEKMGGEYVMFIDSDDELYPDTINSLECMMGANIGSSVGGYIHINEHNKTLFELMEVSRSVALEEAILDFYKTDQKDWQRYLWNRMFRTKVIRALNIRFREDVYFKEDGVFLIQYLVRCGLNIAYTDKLVYKYRINDLSATATIRNGFNPKLLTNILAHSIIVNDILACVRNNKILWIARKEMFASYLWVVGTISNKDYKNGVIQEYLPLLINCIGKENYDKLILKHRINFVVNIPRIIISKFLRLIRIIL